MTEVLCTLTTPWPMQAAAQSYTVVRLDGDRLTDRKEIVFEYGSTIRSLVRDDEPGRYLACSDAEVVALDENLDVVARWSDPRFNDLHDVARADGKLIVCNTGFDEVLLLDADGTIGVLHDFTKLYGPSEVPRLADNRHVCYETRLHAAHPNRARHCDPDDPELLICSIFKTGRESADGAILGYRGDELVWSVGGPELRGNHGPRAIPGGGGELVTCSSFRGQLLAFTRNGQRRLWGAFNFPKDVLPLDPATFVVADSGNDRVVCVDGEGKVLWEVACENSPYSLELAW
jgi:hypothetical protein